jgi:hypothetical protein
MLQQIAAYSITSQACESARRAAAEKTDDWHCQLLRAREERPGYRAAQERDEFASFQLMPSRCLTP